MIASNSLQVNRDYKKNLSGYKSIPPVPDVNFANNPTSKLFGLQRLRGKVIGLFFRYKSHGRKIHPGQSTMARKLKCSVSHLQNELYALASLKLISITQRPFYETNIYELSDYFMHSDIQAQLSHLIPEFAKLPIVMLASLMLSESIRTEKQVHISPPGVNSLTNRDRTVYRDRLDSVNFSTNRNRNRTETEPVSHSVIVKEPGLQEITTHRQKIKSKERTQYYKEKVRSKMADPRIEAVKNIKSLIGLDHKDMHDLMVFPLEVIKQTDTELIKSVNAGRVGSVFNPMGYFVKTAKRILSENHLSYDYSLYNSYAETMQHFKRKPDHSVSFAAPTQTATASAPTKEVFSDNCCSSDMSCGEKSNRKRAAYQEKKQARNEQYAREQRFQQDLINPRATIESMFKRANPAGLKTMGKYFPEHLVPYLTDEERQKLAILDESNRPKPQPVQPTFHVDPEISKIFEERRRELSLKEERVSLVQSPTTINNLSLEQEYVPYIDEQSVWEEV